jgi:hypothetical protein
MKNATEEFNEWFDTKGARTYSKDHGSAEGHRQYMAAAFLDGYHIAVQHFHKLLLDHDSTKTE